VSDVVVRFAPSPTGPLHIGSAIVAIANRAFARAHAGTLTLRIDDTDTQRSEARWVEGILDGLDWLGVGWDGEPIAQSQRTAQHERQLRRLLESGAAYPCFCSEDRLTQLREQQQAAGQPPRYDGRCRELGADEAASRAQSEPHVVRLRVDGEHPFEDRVHGAVAAPVGSFGDFILRRTDGGFSYLFASTVDDVELGITHVLRGEDHLPNTPRQIAICRALGAPIPTFAHLPLLRGVDGTKLSKRDPYGTLADLMDAGYMPETVRRYAAELLGQGPRDPLAVDAAPFELERVPTGAPKLDPSRLESLGQEDLGAMNAESVAAALGEQGVAVAPNELDLLAELAGQSPNLGRVMGDLEALRTAPDGAVAAAQIEPAFVPALETALRAVERPTTEWPGGPTETLRTWALDNGTGTGQTLRALRMAITGSRSGPKLDAVLCALGRDEVARRLRAALA
jgi:glutamyl-tRNA synthetase